MKLRSFATTVLVGALAGTFLAGCADDASRPTVGSSTTAAPDTTPVTEPAPSLPLLRAIRGDGARIVDVDGRQVLLRGVNVNSIAEYHQADPSLPTVVPVTDDDWAAMADHGLTVVRLLVSWSLLEPTRGAFDEDYVARIRETVRAAAAHGIYAVVDMHQDAWSPFIASPPDVVCPDGTTAAIGWDGAPEWATPAHSPEETCRPDSRESSEVVLRAWDNFYADTDGLMTALVDTWGKLAGALADETSIAGYDLLNEPNHGHDDDVAKVRLGAYFDRAITAIRTAEQAAGAPEHIAFFETTVFGLPVESDFTTDDNIVFAPHNYGESIGTLPIDGIFGYFQTLADGYGTAMWIGEYGFFSDPPTSAEKLGRYAKKDDELITAGSAWWQWRQACGDPHSVGTPGGTPDPVQIHLQRNLCPGDRNDGIIPEWKCVWRAFPHAAPGTITGLTSDCDGAMSMSGTTDAPGSVQLWVPGDAEPTLTGTGIADPVAERRGIGWIVTATVTGNYEVAVARPAP